MQYLPLRERGFGLCRYRRVGLAGLEWMAVQRIQDYHSPVPQASGSTVSADLRGKNVLLVDDLLQSGASMNVVARAIKPSRWGESRLCIRAYANQELAMTRVFVAGSRAISKLNDQIKERLDHIMTQQLSVLVGDASGLRDRERLTIFEWPRAQQRKRKADCPFRLI
jgi:hypoxanthine phosphoribosyltransferase